MNKLKKLITYLESMKQRLDKEDMGPEKKAWVMLEIRRTQIDIDRLTLGGK